MRPRLPVLEEVTIATPCTASWEEMSGDDRVRHCGICDLEVFNLSGMTRAQAESLLASRGPRLCVRLYRRHDGTVITQDCPEGIARLRRRMRRAAVAVAGVVAFFSAYAFAGIGVPRPRRAPSAGVFESPTVHALFSIFSGRPPVAPPPPLMGSLPPPPPAPTGTTAIKSHGGGTP